MKLLHTSDWHLGAELEGQSREEEHQHFLDWLYAYMDEQDTELLLVAGDIFHQSTPSGAALGMFTQFLNRLEGLPRLRRAIFTAGNHDGALRLEALSPLLEGRKSVLVGRYLRDREEDLLIPVQDEHGKVVLGVAAVPYIHESRLAIQLHSGDLSVLREATVDEFRRFYTDLAVRAKAQWGDIPLVAMGHMTCGKATSDDYGTALHNVGIIDTLPATIFPEEHYRYAALGHIHRSYRVDHSIAHYSGSPLTFRFNRSELSTRYVLSVNALEGSYTRVPIPLIRQLVQLVGDEAKVRQELETLAATSGLDTWVNIVLHIDEPQVDALTRFRSFAPEKVQVLSLQQRRAQTNEVSELVEALPDVRQMTPYELMESLYRLRHGGGQPSLGVRQKFESVVVEVDRESAE